MDKYKTINYGPMNNDSYSAGLRHAAPFQTNIFGHLDDNLLVRAEALGVDFKSEFKPNSGHGIPKPENSFYGHPPPMSYGNGMPPRFEQEPQPSSGDPGDLSKFYRTAHPSGGGGPMQGGVPDFHPSMYGHPHPGMPLGHPPLHPHSMAPIVHNHGSPEADCDPRELEAFAERFKQRRIKLGITQADVGQQLANLKLPGVGSLSQSTICRFESLTLSHNNMVALKPILQAWLEKAEAEARSKRQMEEQFGPSPEKKRKRTSIAAPEKRSLEAYFAVQPRPSGEKIAQIADKLDLKKNVVRVWFCNQRQKQKRMKFSAAGAGAHSAR